jgi:hypothetical protein
VSQFVKVADHGIFNRFVARTSTLPLSDRVSRALRV